MLQTIPPKKTNGTENVSEKKCDKKCDILGTKQTVQKTSHFHAVYIPQYQVKKTISDSYASNLPVFRPVAAFKLKRRYNLP